MCIACRRVVCVDCATRLDGINHCKECLEKKLGAVAAPAAPFWRRAERVLAAFVITGAFAALFGGYTALGYAASDLDWFGSGLSDTARALEETTDALRRFQKDVGRFPSEREGLRALLVDDPVDGEGAIASWRGPYLRPRKGADTDAALLLDGYGSRLRYVGAGRARPGVLSIGANKDLETEAASLRLGDPASGDDRVRWVH